MHSVTLALSWESASDLGKAGSRFKYGSECNITAASRLNYHSR